MNKLSDSRCIPINTNRQNAKVPFSLSRVVVNSSQKKVKYSLATPTDPVSKGPFSSSMQTPLHHHNYFEIMCVLSGELTQNIEHKTFRYTTGQCCLLNRNINHSEIYTTSAEIMFIMLAEEFLTPLIDSHFVYSTNNLYPNTFEHISLLIEKNKENKYYTAKEYIDFTLSSKSGIQAKVLNYLIDLINMMFKETVEHRPGCTFIMAGLIERLFSLLEDPKYYEQKVNHLIGTQEEKLFNEVSILLQSQKDRISRSELETRIHYNADYLNKIVKRMTGMTLTEYGQLFRLQEAAERIKTSNNSISSIVAEFGFTNRSYFNKIFKAKYNVTPEQLRKNSN